MNCWRSSNCEYCSESYILRSMYDYWKEAKGGPNQTTRPCSTWDTHCYIHSITAMMLGYAGEKSEENVSTHYPCEYLDHFHVNTKRKHFEWQNATVPQYITIHCCVMGLTLCDSHSASNSELSCEKWGRFGVCLSQQLNIRQYLRSNSGNG